MTDEVSPDLESPDSPTQLRALAADKVACTYAYGPDLRRAADEIERLREALEPFSEAAELYCRAWSYVQDDHETPVKVGELRNARAALKETQS